VVKRSEALVGTKRSTAQLEYPKTPNSNANMLSFDLSIRLLGTNDKQETEMPITASMTVKVSKKECPEKPALLKSKHHFDTPSASRPLTHDSSFPAMFTIDPSNL